jgi:hypothetical protein
MSEFKSCSSCAKPEATPNDIYAGCPAIMADGRLFTNWRPKCAQAYIDMQGKMMSSYDNRQNLITNAVDIMKQNAASAYNAAKCGPCYENPDWNTGTMLPERIIQVCTPNACTFVLNNEKGLGVGRQYWNPKMESEYQNQFIALKEKEQGYFKGQVQGNASTYSSDFMSITK